LTHRSANDAPRESHPSPERLRAITYATGIGIILVVFGHAHDPALDSEGDAVGHFISLLRAFVFTFHMPLFFAISGFLYQYTNQLHRRRTYLELGRGKAVRLLLPYVVVSSLVYPIKCLLSRFAMRPPEWGWGAYVESLGTAKK